jgi:hypothetical protein
MSSKEKPRTNPRAGSSEKELWDTELDWYFNVFESMCGLQSTGTSGAGENQLKKPTEAEKLDRREKTRNGFLLTMLGPPKADSKSVSAAQADKAAFHAMSRGLYARGRRLWRRLTRLPYEERIREAGADWGRPPLTDDQVRAAHRAYYELF